jgi:hypothetical protein
MLLAAEALDLDLLLTVRVQAVVRVYNHLYQVHQLIMQAVAALEPQILVQAAQLRLREDWEAVEMARLVVHRQQQVLMD